jgi:hypothetical protein
MLEATGLTGPTEAGGDLCGLGSIVASLNESLSRVLQLAQWWVEGGDLETQTASIAMNTDLAVRLVSADLVNAIKTVWKDGGISRETMLDWFKRCEILPEGRTVEQERALIHGRLRVEG